MSSQKLEAALSEGTLSEWEKTKYIILLTVLSLAFSPVFWLTPKYSDGPGGVDAIISLLALLLNVVLTVKGLKNCYNVNKNADDKNFIERFTVLYVPMVIKFTLIIIPLFFAFSAFVGFRKESSPVLFSLYPTIVQISGPIAIYVFFRLLRRSFNRLSVNINGMSNKVEPFMGADA
jgi:hypothetical protein